MARGLVDHLGAQPDLPRLPLPAGWHWGHFTLDLPQVVLAAVLGLCLAVLITAVVRLRGRGEAGWDARADDAAAAAPSETHLQRAEAFDAAGQFMEAMHELLLQCVADIRVRGGARLEESLTSREILARAKLPPSGREALAEIILRVERTYFGRSPADPAQWQECRAQFSALRGALGAHG